MKILKKIIMIIRCHDWETSGTNGFYIPDEERCTRCGEYRHRILKAKNLSKTPEWKGGRHPQSKIA